MLLLVVIVAAALVASIRAALPVSPRPELAVVVGLLPLAVLLARPAELGYSARLWRAGVFGKFSGRDSSRQELARVVEAAATPAEQRLAAGFWKAYGPGTPLPPPGGRPAVSP